MMIVRIGVVAMILVGRVIIIPNVSAEETSRMDVLPAKISVHDWPWWRGPRHDGIAHAEQQPPTDFDEHRHVVWQVPIPGRGHGSPTVCGPHIFLATADHQLETQSVLCFDRTNGERLWETVVHRGGLMHKNEKASQASSTVACDGDRVYINFLSGGAVHTTALSLQGEKLWQQKITDYIIHQGYGSSPIVYDDLLLVSADNKGGGAVAAINRENGDIVWRRDRPKTPNYPSPSILRVAGRDQMLLTGCDRVSSFNPRTGETLWEIDGATTECVTTTVTDGAHIYTSGGYPSNHVSAVLADGSGKIVWSNNSRVYVPSMFVKEGYLYAILDAGIATCWKCDTGESSWKERLGGSFTASPVLVGDRVYAINEEGQVYIFRATPERFETIATTKLGDEALATPTICGGRIYARVAKFLDDKRQEILFCIGN